MASERSDGSIVTGVGVFSEKKRKWATMNVRENGSWATGENEENTLDALYLNHVVVTGVSILGF
jgi:hypothetical protein